MERFNLKKLNEVEGKEQYRVEISNRFAALENLDTEVDVNKAWETIKENIKISAKENPGYYELKQHKPWFVKVHTKLIDQRKEAKLQWLQDPSKQSVIYAMVSRVTLLHPLHFLLLRFISYLTIYIIDISLLVFFILTLFRFLSSEFRVNITLLLS
jgi:hypothetical protein